jgi:hypothetical protein
MAKLLTGTRVYGTANVDNVLRVGNITPVNSTSNTTGSLIVVGGVGILGNTYTGNLIISGSTAAGNGITFADGTRMTTAAVGGGGGASPSGYLANSVIFANTTGVLANTSNIQFFASNNTFVASNVKTSGAVTVTNTASSITGSIVFNAAASSIDFIFN